MKRFWEYCFYRYCQFYLKHPLINFGLTKGYASFGERFVSTQQLLNILFLYFLIFGKIIDVNISNLCFLVGFAIVCVLLGIVNKKKYNKITYKRLEKKYKFEKNRRLKGWLVVFYWLLSTFLFFAVVFF